MSGWCISLTILSAVVFLCSVAIFIWANIRYGENKYNQGYLDGMKKYEEGRERAFYIGKMVERNEKGNHKEVSE